MNKAITDGLVLMPPQFANGLDVWSSGDGTPGSDTYDNATNAAFVPADADFAGALEVQKNSNTTKVRYTGETPILPGCYLKVTARVKAISGPLPSVRIAGWAGTSGGAHANVASEVGPSTALTNYGQVVEISAIIGTGQRTGVDMVWNGALYGHIGLDLTGSNGGVVRIDDLEIEDVTNVFIRDMMGLVDVRDYGAIGDGVTDDSAAFDAADNAAGGRKVLISEGVYFLGSDVTFQNEVQFEGTVVMPDVNKLILQRNYDYPTYLDAFGDEQLALKKAFQALLNFSDHESLDLAGRRISLTEPLDMQAAEGTKTTFATRRVMRNGQIQAVESPAWDPEIFTSQGTYSVSSPTRLSNVTNVANIPVGSHVSGNGVGREIYVRSKNVGAGTLELSAPLYDGDGTQVFTFTRFKYLFDFSGFDHLASFVVSDIEFQCDGRASGILLPSSGLAFHMRDCFITRPRDRGLTSPGVGCQGLLIDRCQFLSNEQPERAQDRTTISFNTNANDVKLRDNRCVLFKHFAVMGGTGHTIVGNHWFHGDTEPNGVRKGGIILTSANPKTLITGNYIDNNFIEWTNEHDATPDQGGDFSFGALTITGNIFFCTSVADWFNFIVIKPYGANHFINGLAVTSNVFKTFNGFIDRVEHVDTTFADLKYNSIRNVTFKGNTYNGVNEPVVNPAILKHTQSTAASTWTLPTEPFLPFKGWARTVESVCPEGAIQNASNANVYNMPAVFKERGADKRNVELTWPQASKGTVRYTVRMDNPIS